MNLDSLKETFGNVLKPALVGAAGTGALGTYIASQSHPENELPGQRRKRILRQALLSAGLGGAAGAALPAGIKMLSDPYFGNGVMGGHGVVDRATDMATSHALPLAAGGSLAYWAHAKAQANERGALKSVLGALKGQTVPEDVQALGIKEVNDMLTVKRLFASGPVAKQWMLRALGAEPPKDTGMMSDALRAMSAGTMKQTGTSPGGWNPAFRAVDILREAGHPDVTHSDVGNMFRPTVGPADETPYKDILKPMSRDVQGDMATYMKSQPGIMSRIMGYLGTPRTPHVPEWLEGGRLEKALTSAEPKITTGAGKLMEMFARVARPGAATLRTGMGPIGSLGLIGGGVLGAHYLQKKLLGD